MNFTEYQQVSFTTERCCFCSVRFAMDTDTYNRRKADGRGFFCPNGHQQFYSDSTSKRLETANSEISKLKSQLQLERDQKAATEKSLDLMKSRVSKGVCPCCKRTVSQLARHMATKHPNYPKT